MSVKREKASEFAALAAGVWVVCFYLFAADAAGWYSFERKWPDVPEAWRFASPHSVAVDLSGNVFVADTENHKVKKFDSSGNLLDEWGCEGEAEGEFSYPRGIAVDSSGNVFVVDTENRRIQKFDSSGTFLAKWGSHGSDDGEFGGGGYGEGPGPIGVAVDSSGDVFVADTENRRIQKFDSSGNFLAKWGSYGSRDGEFSSPQGIAVDSSGNIFVADTGNDRIQRFSPPGEFLLKWGSRGSGDGQFNSPGDVVVDSSGDILVADSGNDRIQKFDSMGNFVAVWGNAGSAEGEFDSPSGIVADSAGNILVADTGNDRIQKFDSSGNFLDKWGYRGSADGEFSGPGSVAADSSGNIFVVDTGNHRVQKFDSSGNYLGKWGCKGSGNGEFTWPFVWPPGIAVDSSGDVLVADTGNARIQRFDSSGIFMDKWSYYDPGGGAPLQPYGVAVDSSGNVFVTDAEHCWVLEFDSAGNFVNKWGSLGSEEGQFSGPRGIAVDSSGNVFVADSGNHRIQEFDSSGNFLAQWGSEGPGDGEFSNPYSIAVDSSGNVFVADTGNHRIQEFDSSGNFLAQWGSEGPGDGEFKSPHGIAVDSSGNVFIADTDNHRIQKFRRLQPMISLEPDSLSNSCDGGQDAPSQDFEMWNSSGGTLSYTIDDDVAWLSCDPSSGISEEEHDTITVSYRTSALEQGTYHATITISDPNAGNSPQQVEVTLTVRSNIPAIGCQPASLYSSCNQGQNALPKTFDVFNTSGGTLSYTITDDVGWLICTPDSGTSTRERDTITVRYNTAGLEPGSYSARITVSAPNVANSPQNVDVSLTVRPQPAAIGRQPDSLSNACDQGEDARSQSFEVWNTGGGTLSYTIADDVAWLSCIPAIGTSTGEHDTVAVSYDTSVLEPGDYSATITVSDPNATNTPQTIDVSITVHPVTADGTLAAGSETTIKGDQTAFPITISLDLPFDLTYLALRVEFHAGLFQALDYAQEGRVTAAPSPDGIDNPAEGGTGEVRIVWLSLSGETVIPAGSGPIATIQFEQKPSAYEGTYPVTLSAVEARYGPQVYHLQLIDGEIRVVEGSLDVDQSGAVEAATDIVYIFRYLVEMPMTVPSSFREIDPSIPPDGEIESRIDSLKPLLDVDASGGEPDPATDIVYIYRYLVGMPTTVPTVFRDVDPSIPPDEEINARVDAINQISDFGFGISDLGFRIPQSALRNGKGLLRVAQVAGQRGKSMSVEIALDSPDDDLTYLRLWVEYDRTKLSPTVLREAGRTSVEPMPDWLDKENGRIRAVVESLRGDVVVPRGTGAVLEMAFDVLEDTTSSDSLRILEDVEAGLGPKKALVSILRPAVIGLTPSGAVSVTWQPFGGGSYTVLCCDNLQSGNWTPVQGTEWPTAETSWQSQPPSSVRRRFYRVTSD